MGSASGMTCPRQRVAAKGALDQSKASIVGIPCACRRTEDSDLRPHGTDTPSDASQCPKRRAERRVILLQCQWLRMPQAQAIKRTPVAKSAGVVPA